MFASHWALGLTFPLLIKHTRGFLIPTFTPHGFMLINILSCQPSNSYRIYSCIMFIQRPASWDANEKHVLTYIEVRAIQGLAKEEIRYTAWSNLICMETTKFDTAQLHFCWKMVSKHFVLRYQESYSCFEEVCNQHKSALRRDVWLHYDDI